VDSHAYRAVRNPTSDHDADESSDQAKTTLDGGGAGSPHGDDSLENVAVSAEGTGKCIDAEESREDDIVIDEDDGQGEGDEEDESDDDDENDQDVEDDDDGDDEDNDEDEDRSEFDPDFEFEWLEPIDVEVTSTANLDECGEPKKVAYCKAKLIRRNQMRYDFYGEMEPPSRETSMLAFDLFDRYGRLRSEFKTHPVIKGTGVWGQELDCGDMLLIEEVFVNQDYRRQRLGRRMIESLLTLARQKTWSFFAFVWPTFLNLHDLKLEWNSLQDDAAILTDDGLLLEVLWEVLDALPRLSRLYLLHTPLVRILSTAWAMGHAGDNNVGQLSSWVFFLHRQLGANYLINHFTGDRPIILVYKNQGVGVREATELILDCINISDVVTEDAAFS
jgi:GNAT superfamily N-acetyltransferase